MSIFVQATQLKITWPWSLLWTFCLETGCPRWVRNSWMTWASERIYWKGNGLALSYQCFCVVIVADADLKMTYTSMNEHTSITEKVLRQGWFHYSYRYIYIYNISRRIMQVMGFGALFCCFVVVTSSWNLPMFSRDATLASCHWHACQIARISIMKTMGRSITWVQ